MKLESVRIKRFRSIEDQLVPQCGDFNVLIGKNNSGKSNVLSAISAFFNCAQNANIVTLDPHNGREIDFFGKKLDLPIEITLRLTLSENEKTELLTDIIEEAPQMKNAVDGFAAILSLEITVTINPPLRAFAIVSKISLVDGVGGAEYVLLSVDKNSAIELRDKAAASLSASRDIEGLRNLMTQFTEDFWSTMHSRGTLRSDWRIYFPRRGVELTHETSAAVDDLFVNSTTYAEFQKGMQTLSTNVREEDELILKEKLQNKVETFAGEESSVPAYVLNLLTRLSNVKVLYLREYRKQIGKDEAQQLLSLKVQRGGTDVLRNIQGTVDDLLGVRIDAFQGPSRGTRIEPEAELDVDDFLVQVNGSGVREALRLILDVEFEHPTILMVEEPETHLHPALEISMMHYLKRISESIQVFATTHSTNFLDTAEMKNVYLVSKDKSTKIQLLNYEEAESQIPSELGLRLSSLFMFDRLVFVEGPSDEGVFREWASTLRVNFSQANVGFVAMGGVKNFTHYAAQATLSFLSKRQIGIWFVIDRDEKEPSEITVLEGLFDGKATVKVLSKREVENFMIAPRAIKEFIAAKKALGSKKDNDPPTELEISQALDAEANNLKQMAIDKRVAKSLCKPVYPSAKALFDETSGVIFTDRLANELEKMSTQIAEAQTRLIQESDAQTKQVNDIWNTQKLSLVQGDILLDKVCQKFGVRFKKERDSARLAALMKEGEIDTEIAKLIREIGGQ